MKKYIRKQEVIAESAEEAARKVIKEREEKIMTKEDLFKKIEETNAKVEKVAGFDAWTGKTGLKFITLKPEQKTTSWFKKQFKYWHKKDIEEISINLSEELCIVPDVFEDTAVLTTIGFKIQEEKEDSAPIQYITYLGNMFNALNFINKLSIDTNNIHSIVVSRFGYMD